MPDLDEPKGFFSREPSNRIEPQFEPAFAQWQKTRGPAESSHMLSLLKPTIDKAISAHVGAGNPLLRSRARRMTLDALDNYDPQRARLATHVTNRLQGLKRVARQQTQILPVPERVSLDQAKLKNIEDELKLELGRPPSTMELADHSGLSPARLTQLRQYRPARSEGSFAALENADGEEGGFDPSSMAPPERLHLELTYGDLDPINQKILEWTLGMHGQKTLSNQAIAAKLGLTPGAISQRKARIQAALDRSQEMLPF
jgi:DNA-directed RNA polymerase specialized sigma subunit